MMTTPRAAVPKATAAAAQKPPHSMEQTVENLIRAIDSYEVFFTYIACLLTPVSILIVQIISYGALANILILCDLFFLAKFCKLLRDKFAEPSSKSKRHSKNSNSERDDNYFLFLAFLTFDQRGVVIGVPLA
jgi:hypothetical protein